MGARVALMEKERVGGNRLNIGYIPTKALITATDLLVEARHAEDLGVVVSEARPELLGLMTYKDEAAAVVETLLGPPGAQGLSETCPCQRCVWASAEGEAGRGRGG